MTWTDTISWHGVNVCLLQAVVSSSAQLLGQYPLATYALVHRCCCVWFRMCLSTLVGAGSQQGTGVIHMYRAARVRSAPYDTFECLQSVFGQQGFAVQHVAMRGLEPERSLFGACGAHSCYLPHIAGVCRHQIRWGCEGVRSRLVVLVRSCLRPSPVLLHQGAIRFDVRRARYCRTVWLRTLGV